MLVIKKEIDFQDFEDLFSFELNHLPYEASRIIYDYLLDREEDLTEDEISDYIRYQINVMSIDEIISDYNYMMDEEEFQQLEADGEDLTEYVENFLNDYTTVLGTYEEDGETYFIFEEF